MAEYLDFNKADCKNCYRCLRNCPVKAIRVETGQARVIDDRCILCGHCVNVCPQNAKRVHSGLEAVEKLLSSDAQVVASLAPSFVSSFSADDFGVMRAALKLLGFAEAEETAVGANCVTAEYDQLLKSGKYKNLISTACPSIVRMVREYYPRAIEFLAPVDSPMVAHAKLIKHRAPHVKVVFIGPCIAKKREADETGVVDGVLTFEELKRMFEEKGIDLKNVMPDPIAETPGEGNKAKFYPISRGIIKSFDGFVDGYEYLSVDGVKRCREVLEDIGSLSGFFLELNACEFACVNGPCSLLPENDAIRSTAAIRKYAGEAVTGKKNARVSYDGVNISAVYSPIKEGGRLVSEYEIEQILKKTNKFRPEDELNCGACGYSTCREKAWAVANGYADVEMCLPYMRERAETMSYEIIHNSPNGIVLLDGEYRIVDINMKARELYGIDERASLRGENAFDWFNPTDFIVAAQSGGSMHRTKTLIDKTGRYVELTVTALKEHNVFFGIMKDISPEVENQNQLRELTEKTLETTDEVIKKQMRVAQEIASLLGETTAETKVALLKLKKTLAENGGLSDNGEKK